MKRKIKLGLGFFSAPTAWRTIQGNETMHRTGKREIGKLENGKHSSPESVLYREVWASHVSKYLLFWITLPTQF